MEDDSAFTYKKEKSVGSLFLQAMFSHVGLFVIVSLYTVFGARMFIDLEIEAENQRYEAKRLNAEVVKETIDYTANLIWYYGDETKHDWTFSSYNKTLYKDLMRMEDFILESIANNNYDGTRDGWTWDWTFMNSLLLCMTILTTIGYGNVTPVTFEGQMFCIAYALIGCPLFLVFLANLGDAMAEGFTYIYSRCCCRCCRSKRYISELPDNCSLKHRKHVIDDVVGEEEYMPTSKVFVPIVINVVLLHLYFLLGGLLFASWENWDTTASIYFTFITLSTIGYGDYVPGNSLADKPDSMTTTLKLLVCVLFIVLGMALLSMCINLMQEQIVQKCKWASEKMGFSGDKDDKNGEVSQPSVPDRRKDSLAPIMDQNKGPSPFRNTSAAPHPDNKRTSQGSLPGIINSEY